MKKRSGLSIPSLYFLSEPLSWWDHVNHGFKCHLFMGGGSPTCLVPVQRFPLTSALMDPSAWLMSFFEIYGHCERSMSRMNVSFACNQTNQNQAQTKEPNTQINWTSPFFILGSAAILGQHKPTKSSFSLAYFQRGRIQIQPILISKATQNLITPSLSS